MECTLSDFSMWILTTLTSSAAIALLGGFAVWLGRTWISARLTASLRTQTEMELATFRSRLEAAERQVNSVRDAGLEAARSTNAAVLRERVIATREIARALVELNSIAALSMLIAGLTTEWVIKNAGLSHATTFAEGLLKASNAESLLTRVYALGEYRPFVTEQSWALFSAIQSFYAARVAKCAVLRAGNAEMARRLWHADSERKLIETIIPAQLDAYDRNPFEVENTFAETVRSELLNELRRGLSGGHTGAEAVHDARAILSATEETMRTVEDMQRPKPPNPSAPRG